MNFTEARDSELQWHLLGHMQVCTLLQSDNHASTQPDALPAAQATASKHWRQQEMKDKLNSQQQPKHSIFCQTYNYSFTFQLMRKNVTRNFCHQVVSITVVLQSDVQLSRGGSDDDWPSILTSVMASNRCDLYLSGILVDHDDDLGHVVEFRHTVDVLHRPDPLLIHHRLCQQLKK